MTDCYGFAVTENETVRDEVARLRRLQGVGKFAAGIVHDFNNVLGAVVAFVDSRSRQAESELDQRLMKQLNDSLTRGVHLLRAVSIYALDGARKRERVEVDALVADVFTLLATSLRHADVTITRETVSSPSVRVHRANVMELLVQIVLYCLDHVGPSREIKVVVHEVERDGRRFASVSMRLDGDASADAGLRKLASRPEDGFDEVAEGLARQSDPILTGVMALHLGGGLFECVEEPRTLAILLPVCRDPS